MPPPPPPPPPSKGSAGGPSRRALLAIMLGGAALWWNYLNNQMPKVYTDELGIRYLKTAGGNTVAVSQDAMGRISMVDAAGNLYYDTGDKRLGVYIVDTENNMYNLFIDGDGREQRVLVGNLSELQTFDVNRIGGIPVDDIKVAAEGRDNMRNGGRLTAFPDATPVPLPPNAPANVTKDGEIGPPAVLEEGALLLDEKRSLWPFGQKNDGGGPYKRGM
ncbi:hypothetical protein WJX72_005356 [[Myrmecia] bisecta]|uniref:Uncharacterized protein n=1 Tax=[Myrmecia] bisecta TaxID=41462 RepID=A0AAW1QFA8_9CHLO